MGAGNRRMSTRRTHRRRTSLDGLGRGPPRGWPLGLAALAGGLGALAAFGAVSAGLGPVDGGIGLAALAGG